MNITFDSIIPLARRTDPHTSHAAAHHAVDLARNQYVQILECLVQYGPLGKDGIAALVDLTGVAVARRLSEMQKLDLCEPTGRTVKSHSGRSEREWKAI